MDSINSNSQNTQHCELSWWAWLHFWDTFTFHRPVSAGSTWIKSQLCDCYHSVN